MSINDNLTISISPAIAFGKAFGVGANITATYSKGNYTMAAGFGFTHYGAAYGTGHRGFETRWSGAAVGGLFKNANNFIRGSAMIGAGGLSGGVGSVIAGGNFWDGARNGLISSGLNHAAHSGVFGKGLSIALITGRIRHLFGPDAVSASISGNASGIIDSEMEAGGLAVLRGTDAGFDTISDIGIGIGTVDASLTLEITKLYHTGNINDIRLIDFYGRRIEVNAGIDVGYSVGVNYSRSEVYRGGVHTHTVYGAGFSIGYGASATLLSGNINWGASGRNLHHVERLMKYID